MNNDYAICARDFAAMPSHSGLKSCTRGNLRTRKQRIEPFLVEVVKRIVMASEAQRFGGG